MRSGGGVLLVSSLQMLVGLVLLGVYEGYKARAVKRGSHALNPFGAAQLYSAPPSHSRWRHRAESLGL